MYTTERRQNVHIRFTRMAVVAATIALPIVGAVAVSGAPAMAATKSITCTASKGTVNSTTGQIKLTYSGCSGNTGGKGSSVSSASSGSSTATIKWANKKSTTVSTTAAAGTFKCPKGEIAEAVSGKVTKDTTGSASKGGAVSESICYNMTKGTFSLAKGTVATI
jgi:hypothetical protein